MPRDQKTIRKTNIRKAFRKAVQAIQGGDKDLVYDPRCGTSLLVAVMLLALLAVGVGAVGLFATLSFTTLLGLFRVVALLPIVAVRPLGLLAQRLVHGLASFQPCVAGEDHPLGTARRSGAIRRRGFGPLTMCASA